MVQVKMDAWIVEEQIASGITPILPTFAFPQLTG
jgi:hypothetical protein